jgi:hypothetical protein
VTETGTISTNVPLDALKFNFLWTASRLTDTIQNALIQILWMPMQIVVLSFTSIIFALLYLKTRQTGGESMDDLLGQFESVESPDTNWQKRVRERLLQSGRITGRSHNT